MALALELDPALDVRSAGSGEEALGILAGGFAADVVLLDVMMPLLDGPATLLRLRRLAGHQHTPVIFMTARAQTHEQARYLALGAVGVITKPFDPMLLAVQIRNAARLVMAEDPLAALQARFRERGSETAARIRVHLSGNQDLGLEQLVHNLAGAAGLFGQAELGQAALAADAAFTDGGQPAPDALADLAERLERLSSSAQV